MIQNKKIFILVCLLVTFVPSSQNKSKNKNHNQKSQKKVKESEAKITLDFIKNNSKEKSENQEVENTFESNIFNKNKDNCK